MIDVVSWAESTWRVPETKELIVLRPWQREVLWAIHPPDGSPSRFETFLISTVKKAGKTEVNGIGTAYAALTRPGATVYCIANDLQQSQDRIFERIASQCRASGMVRRREVTVTKDTITFLATGTKIQALASDAAGAAGAIFDVSSWTEIWAYEHPGHVRLYEELTPIPGRNSLRIIDSYAGYVGAAPILEPLWDRMVKGERLHDELPIYADGRTWAYVDQGEEAQARCWLGDPAERDRYYDEQRRSLRAGTFARLHLNQWQSGQEAFLTREDWDRCVYEELRPIGRNDEVPVFVGVDIGMKRDCSAVVTVAWVPERIGQRRLQVLDCRVWRNAPGVVLDLHDTVVPYIRELARRFVLRRLLFDPSQFLGASQVLAPWMPVPGIGTFSTREDDPQYAPTHETMQELAQSLPNLTRATGALYDLVKTCQLAVFADDTLRQHVLNAVAIETASGLRLAKEKASRKIDAAAALSFACLAAVTNPPDGDLEPACAESLMPSNVPTYSEFGAFG